MPAIPEAFTLALQHHQAGRLREAEILYRQVLDAQPKHADALHCLGVIAHQAGRHWLAVDYIGRALALNPSNSEYHNNIGEAYRAQGKLEKAMTHYRQALALNPSYVEAHNNLGLALNALGKSEEAVGHFRQALALRPSSEGYRNLGSFVMRCGKPDEAIAYYKKAAESKPEDAEITNQIGVCHTMLGNIEEAEDYYRQAVELDPSCVAALRNLGASLKDQGRVDEAAGQYERAFELQPNDGLRILKATLLPVIPESMDHLLDARRKYERQISELLNQGLMLQDPSIEVGATNFYLAYQGFNDRDLQQTIARLYEKAYPSLVFVAHHCRPGGLAPSGDKIRVGFLSKFFMNHTIGYLTRGLIAQLDRRRFAVSVFLFPQKQDETSEFISRHADRTIVLPAALPAARDLIAQEDLDVLFYPDIGMDPFTYFLAFSRLAPVQCVTWGHPDTTGIPAIDYFVSSGHLEPKGADLHYTERLVRLPHLPVYYYKPDVLMGFKSRADFGLEEGRVIYLCPQSLFKLHPDFDEFLAGVLRADPQGQVVLIEGQFRHFTELIMRRFRHTIPDVIDRIRFLPRQNSRDFIGLLSVVDVILDPVQWSGGSTTYEALSFGTPIVTMPGEFMRGRVTYACYRQLGVPDCIAGNREDYVNLAVRLGTHPEYRAEVKAKLLAANAVLYENAEAVRDLERFFEKAVDGVRRESAEPAATSRRIAMPTIPEAFTLALQHHQAGRLQEAEAIYRRILQTQPEHPDALHLLGLVAHQVGRHDVAVELIGKAIAINPSVEAFHNNIGEAYRAQGKFEDAVNCYRRAVALKPDYAEAYSNQGLVLQAQGKLEEAMVHYRQALTLNPAHAEAHNNLGNVLKTQGNQEEAEAHYLQALTHKPDYAEAHNNLGVTLREQGKLEEAVLHYRHALALKPAFPEAAYNLGNVLQAQGKVEEAVDCYRQALSFRPDYTEAENQLMHYLQHLCEWSRFDELVERHRRRIRKSPDAIIVPFTMLCVPCSPAEQLDCARNWIANHLAGAPALRERLGFRYATASKPKLRLGYLTADCRQHAMAPMLAALFELHDRTSFEVVVYSYGPDDGGSMRKRIAAVCDRFVDIAADSFGDAARRIHEDGIDILIDLQGYTGPARPQIAALRPAPVQVNYLGYPGTMGADFIDYIVTDRFISPPGHEPFFSEKLVWLPDCYQVNDRKREIPEHTPMRHESGLPDDGFVFCCFNNTYKITPVIFDVWMRLLREIPGSVLWLLEANRGVTGNLQREASARGVDPDRLVFAPRVSQSEHFARYRLAGFFLDTLPYNAHVTASEALWAGLPVLTCAGETFASRVAGSLLNAVGLPEMITYSVEDYEARALRLARNPSELAGLRKRLAENRLATPLFDSARYTRYLERAYQMMWETYLKGEAPRRIEVPQ